MRWEGFMQVATQQKFMIFCKVKFVTEIDKA